MTFRGKHLIPMVILLLAMACAEEEHPIVSGDFDPERFATMTTKDVTTLISDSGVMRYKIETPLWLVFDQASEPYWNFPKGVHLEKFDDRMKKDAEVNCDSARYFKTQQLWRLDGYVEIINLAGEKFLTPQLYWDQRHQKLYSDSFIHIERKGRVIEGYGFESNERMTQYNVRRVMAMFPTSEFSQSAAHDTLHPAVIVTDKLPPGQKRIVIPSNRDDSRAATSGSLQSTMPAVMGNQSSVSAVNPLMRPGSATRH